MPKSGLRHAVTAASAAAAAATGANGHRMTAGPSIAQVCPLRRRTRLQLLRRMRPQVLNSRKTSVLVLAQGFDAFKLPFPGLP